MSHLDPFSSGTTHVDKFQFYFDFTTYFELYFTFDYTLHIYESITNSLSAILFFILASIYKQLIHPFVLFKNRSITKNPAYGRHRISRPMRIVGLIQFWRVCVIYLEEEKKEKKMGGSCVHASTHTRVHTPDPRGGNGRSAHNPRFRAPRV